MIMRKFKLTIRTSASEMSSSCRSFDSQKRKLQIEVANLRSKVAKMLLARCESKQHPSFGPFQLRFLVTTPTLQQFL